MLFDLRPKENQKDLFGRGEELQELEKLVVSEWIAIVGARMTGKTSLVKTFVAEKSRRGDAMALYINLLGAKGIRDFVTKLSESLSHKVTSREISLKIPFAEVTSSSRLVEGVFSQLRSTKKDVVVVLDEVQELYRVSGQFLKMLKMIHDTYPRVRFIFTGSMFGLMRTLLKPKTSSPMYGRKPVKIELIPFPEEDSMNFLKRGFKELGTASRKTS